jgi:hypothetical protein
VRSSTHHSRVADVCVVRSMHHRSTRDRPHVPTSRMPRSHHRPHDCSHRRHHRRRNAHFGARHSDATIARSPLARTAAHGGIIEFHLHDTAARIDRTIDTTAPPIPIRDVWLTRRAFDAFISTSHAPFRSHNRTPHPHPRHSPPHHSSPGAHDRTLRAPRDASPCPSSGVDVPCVAHVARPTRALRAAPQARCVCA